MQPSERDTLFGHPKGLFVLFFTEMWERFSYYGMRAILVLFLISEIRGGLAWDKADAYQLYAWYTMMVYVMSIPGGILADRYIGQKKAVMVGGLLLCAGHGIMAVPGVYTFYAALILIVLGVGALKPNISTMVGGLYPQGDQRRDSGFYIFYIGINVGALLASLIVGWVGEKIGWHYGFGLAGIGMALGQLVYLLGQKYLVGIGDAPTRHTVAKTAEEVEAQNRPLTRVEKDRVKVLFLSFFIVIVFWGAFEQAGGLMNVFTKEKIDRSVFGYQLPASIFQGLNAGFIMLFATLVAAFWASRRASSLFKMIVGTMIMGSGFLLMVGASLQYHETGSASLWWLVGAYFLHTIGELCTSPVALSFITKLAPAKYASMMMGLYFAVTGLGNFVAGTLGELSAEAGELEVFAGIFIFCVLFGLAILLVRRPLERLTHGADDVKNA